MRIDPGLTASLATALLLFAGAAVAGQSSHKVTLTDHRFQPDTVTIPAGQKITVTVENADAGPAEFESYDLNREEIINGNSSVTIYIGPLEPGRYDFFDEVHPLTTNANVVGKVLARTNDSCFAYLLGRRSNPQAGSALFESST